jgi:hypothetical protein
VGHEEKCEEQNGYGRKYQINAIFNQPWNQQQSISLKNLKV